MDMRRLTFTEAAKEAGIHPNSIRNWNKAGKLTTVRSDIIRNQQTWTVEMWEVLQIASAGGLTNSDNPNNNNGNQSAIVAVIEGQRAAITKLEEEREGLLVRIDGLQEGRATDRQEIGQLTGQLQQVEKRIATLENDKASLQGDLRRTNRWIAILIATVLFLALVAALVALVVR
ncbi:hypothetical protein OZ401_005101 (plasmid) [Candidatus Chlorohelix allophototropha]|uniref:HTH merR-type domain-containing protein n=1 Tax=Candidatus Chlorohelix allophototropha TaxID=3003348 RepID=A0ABY9BBE3_9CHLR|nr:hypothetical protein OZ401_005101 [Chloroflexota bacterium L227-S17]